MGAGDALRSGFDERREYAAEDAVRFLVGRVERQSGVSLAGCILDATLPREETGELGPDLRRLRIEACRLPVRGQGRVVSPSDSKWRPSMNW